MRTAIRFVLMWAIFVALWVGTFSFMEFGLNITSFAYYASVGYCFYPMFDMIAVRFVKNGN